MRRNVICYKVFQKFETPEKAIIIGDFGGQAKTFTEGIRARSATWRVDFRHLSEARGVGWIMGRYSDR